MTQFYIATIAALLTIAVGLGGYHMGKNEVYETVIHKDKSINCYLGTIADPVTLPLKG